MDGFRWLKVNMYRARECHARTLVHRDFHPNNLLALGDRITGVVDWAGVTIADPAIDVAWSRMILETEVSKDVADQFNEYYWRRQPEVRHTQAFWEVFSACKRLTTIATIRHAANQHVQRESLPPLNPQAMQAVESFMRARLTDEE
jgi:aminoglycoside phosphotransferase (APT) family kinase protein